MSASGGDWERDLSAIVHGGTGKPTVLLPGQVGVRVNTGVTSTGSKPTASAGRAKLLLEASSAGAVRHRLSRDGNRQLNAIVYRIAITQSRWSPQAKAYLRRPVSEGKTIGEALRAFKRYIVRAIWRSWRECRTVESTATDSEAVARFT